MPSDVAGLLRIKRVSRIEGSPNFLTFSSLDGFLYRVFAPVIQQNKVVGIVEITNNLDDLPTILKRFIVTFVLLALMAVGLIFLVTRMIFTSRLSIYSKPPRGD